jgi:hypothetical protein
LARCSRPSPAAKRRHPYENHFAQRPLFAQRLAKTIELIAAGYGDWRSCNTLINYQKINSN